MSPKEKFKALTALDQWAFIGMDVNGNWYISWSLEIGGNGMLDGIYGRGETPEAAIDEHWKIVTELPPSRYLVKNAYTDSRKHFRWNGFMWQELAQDKTKA